MAGIELFIITEFDCIKIGTVELGYNDHGYNVEFVITEFDCM
jgi:hypothetical protein